MSLIVLIVVTFQAQNENDAGWGATFSPGADMVGGKERKMRLENEKKNFKVLADKVCNVEFLFKTIECYFYSNINV
jgi:hypothetical protein